MDQISMFKQPRTSINVKEERLVRMTVSRIMNLKWGLEAAIEKNQEEAKKSEGQVRETYLRIVESYQQDWKYLDEIEWERIEEVEE